MTEKMTITYDTLFDILRLEKSTGELQKLNDNFYEEVVSYLQNKKDILNKEVSEFSEAEKEKTLVQVQNIKKLIKELYEKREKKIVDLASNKSRTGSDIIDLSLLLPEERRLFDQLVKIFSKNRENILTNIMNGKQPTLNETLGVSKETNYKERSNTEKSEDKEEKGQNESETREYRQMPEQQEQETNEENEESKMVRFIHAVPKFLGRKLEKYGPFEADEITNLPKDIADILIRKGRAEEIREQ
jgi:DNA replication initiation complex subunit (GINS family)